MNYINVNTGNLISSTVYSKLSPTAKANFIESEDVVTTKTHTIIETKSDNMSMGDAVVAVAITPLLIIDSLFG